MIYPTYDWAHGQSDAIEGVTHSLCTLEFDSHRALYDWYLEQLPLPFEQPRQTEFARLELTHTVTSKRKLATLVADGIVDGWDDPRMPTLRGLRRRGYPASAIREFCNFIGVARTNSRHQIELLESFVRTELNRTAQRRMAVLRPLRDGRSPNWPTDAAGDPVVEHFEIVQQPGERRRRHALGAVLAASCSSSTTTSWSSRRRSTSGCRPAREVRLRGAYLVTCTRRSTSTPTATSRRCYVTYDPATRGRQRSRRTQGEVDDALGVGRPRASTPRSRCTSGCSPRRCPGERPATPFDDLDPRLARAAHRLQGRAGARRHRARRRSCSSSDSATSPHDPREPMLFHRTVGLRDEWANIQKRST